MEHLWNLTFDSKDQDSSVGMFFYLHISAIIHGGMLNLKSLPLSSYVRAFQ